METIKEAKQHLRDNFEKGVECPCCRQFVKLYKRKLNSGMALTLIRMYKHDSEGWINVKDFLRKNSFTNNHDWTLLQHWGLIEERIIDPEHGGRSCGEWKVTIKGRNFIKGFINVPKRIKLYNSNFYGYDNETTSIAESLGSKFDYVELMKS